MRLLNVHSLQFRSFDHGRRPPYAIASHRWRDGAETTLRDVVEGRNTDSHGYKKVQAFAAFVRHRVPDVEWLWVDTCCIDKSNSQELQETITAMYRWYEGATVCLAYLEDVGSPQWQGSGDDWAMLRRSAWFTRGWTLQELLAPRLVVFLSKEWEVIGHKIQSGGEDEASSLAIGPQINGLVAKTTDIPEAVIARSEMRKALSVEQKLGWMAGRKTTRPEDIAYSLLGIFEVSMPLIYNEGEVAAQRRLIRTIREANEEMSPSPRFPDRSHLEGSRSVSVGAAHHLDMGDSRTDANAGVIYPYPVDPKRTLLLPASTVPFPRDPDFVDRPELSALEQKMSTMGERVAVVGLGGVGKSQLAIEYCYRLRERSPDIWVLWLHASSAVRFDGSIRKLADDLKIPKRKDDGADIYQLVYDRLRDAREGRWLLVLDSADDAEFLFEASENSSNAQDGSGQRAVISRARLDYLPICAHGSILTTSRNLAVATRLVDERNIIEVQPMDKEQALALLERKLGGQIQSDVSRLQRLAAILEYMPLAIAQAAAYIKQRSPRYSVERYLEKFAKSDRSRTSLLDANSAELRRDREASNSIMLTWQISFEHIHQSERSAADLLSLMSFFDHRSIPDWLVQFDYSREHISGKKAPETSGDNDDFDADGDDGQRSGGTSDTSSDEGFEYDIMVLRNYHFISATEGAFAMHRLVQLAARGWLKSQGQYGHWAEQSILHLDATLPYARYEDWERCRILHPHARMILDLKPESQAASLQKASILYKAAGFAWHQGLATEAEAFASPSRDIRRRILGEEDEDTLLSESLLTITLIDQDKYEVAEAINQRTLETRERVLGKEHGETLTSLSNVALVLSHQGKYDMAERIARRVLEGREKVLGKEHGDTLIGVMNLSIMLQQQDKDEAAMALAQRALEARERILGRKHPQTLSSMWLVGSLRHREGRHGEALELVGQAYAGLLEVLGSHHPRTKLCLDDLEALREIADAE